MAKPGAATPSLLHRGLAVCACFASAGLLYHIANLPLASPKVADIPLKVRPGETLALTLPAGERPLFILQGPFLWIEFQRATVDFLPELAEAHAPISGQPVPVVWHSGAGGSGPVKVKLALVHPTGEPRLTLTPGRNQDEGELILKARSAALKATMVGPTSGALEDRIAQLAIDDELNWQIPDGGAVPVPVTTQPDTDLKVSYPWSSASSTAYRITNSIRNELDGLPVSSLAIVRPGGERFRACGSKKRIEWSISKVADIRCAGDHLSITGLKLDNEGLFVDMDGVAFVEVDGKAETYPVDKIRENGVVSTALGLALTGLVGWTARVLFAPLPPLPKWWPHRTPEQIARKAPRPSKSPHRRR